MRNIRGYDVMMSLGDVLRAVIASENNVKFDKQSVNKITATFEGVEPFSTWEHAPSPLEAGKESIGATVQIPRLHSGADLTRHQADTFVGFGLGELSKALYSHKIKLQRAESDSNPMFGALAHAIESVRTEKQLLASEMAPNARRTFESVMDAKYSQSMLQGFDPNDLKWLPSTVDFLARARNGYNMPYVEELKRQMNPDNLKLLEGAFKQMDASPAERAKGTDDSLKIAEELLKKIENPPAGDGKEGKDKKQEQQGKGKGKGQGEGGEGEGEEGEGQGEGADGDKEGQGQGQGEEGEGEDQQGGGEGKPDPTPNPPSQGAPARGYSKPRWHKALLEDACKNMGKLKMDTSNVIGNSVREANKVAEGRHGADVLGSIKLTDELRISEPHEAAEQFRQLKAMIPANLGSMRHALWRLLQSKDEHIVDRFNEFGRWDQRAFPRMLGGQSNLYKVEGDIDGMKTVVSIILDLSGSMGGGAIVNAAVACLAISEVMEQLASHGVAYEILGFCDADYTNGMYGGRNSGGAHFGKNVKKKKKGKRPGWASGFGFGGEDGEYEDGGASRWSSWSSFSSKGYVPYWTSIGRQVGIIEFKGFKDKYAARKNYIAQMVGRPNGGTPDSQGLLVAIKDVVSRPEPNKIVMVLTDGMGDSRGIRAGCKFANQIGVEVIGIGIGEGARAVENVYPISLYAASVAQLGTAAFTALVNQVEKNRRDHYADRKKEIAA